MTYADVPVLLVAHDYLVNTHWNLDMYFWCWCSVLWQLHGRNSMGSHVLVRHVHMKSSMYTCEYVLLKCESHNDANFVLTGGTGGCRYDNLRCHQRPQSWHNGNTQFLPLSPNWARGVLSSPAGRALPHTVTALPGAVLIGSRSNLVGTNLGVGSRTSSFMGDVAR